MYDTDRVPPSDLLRQCPRIDEKGYRTRDRLRSWPFTISIPMHLPSCGLVFENSPLQKFHFLDISPETDRSFRKSSYKLREIHFDTSSGIGVDRAYLYPFPYNHPRFQSRELLFLACYSRKGDSAIEDLVSMHELPLSCRNFDQHCVLIPSS